MSANELNAHLQRDRYGDFRLTEAIRPAPQLPVVPQQGYRVDVYRDPDSKVRMPVLAASVSAERLFDVFVELLEPLGEVVDVVLESSHDSEGDEHRDLIREEIDTPVMLSHFYEFEELILNDGCTGVAVMASGRPLEVQFDEHKLLIVYAQDLRPFERILQRNGIRRNDALKLITEGEHLHSTDPRYASELEVFAQRLGVGEPAELLNG